MSDTDTTEVNFTPRQMFAAAILATHLPMPIRIGHCDGFFMIDLATVADGQAWASKLGAHCDAHVRDGVRYLGARGATWHGRIVLLNAHESATPDGVLDDDTAAQLGDIVGGEPR